MRVACGGSLRTSKIPMLLFHSGNPLGGAARSRVAAAAGQASDESVAGRASVLSSAAPPLRNVRRLSARRCSGDKCGIVNHPVLRRPNRYLPTTGSQHVCAESNGQNVESCLTMVDHLDGGVTNGRRPGTCASLFACSVWTASSTASPPPGSPSDIPHDLDHGSTLQMITPTALHTPGQASGRGNANGPPPTDPPHAGALDTPDPTRP